MLANADTRMYRRVRERSRKRSDEVATDYSAQRASPLAARGRPGGRLAALRAAVRPCAEESGRRTGVAPLGRRCRANTWMYERLGRRRIAASRRGRVVRRPSRNLARDPLVLVLAPGHVLSVALGSYSERVKSLQRRRGLASISGLAPPLLRDLARDGVREGEVHAPDGPGRRRSLREGTRRNRTNSSTQSAESFWGQHRP